MRRAALFLIAILMLACLSSCMTTDRSPVQQFSLTQTQKSQSSTGILKGTVNYGVGYYFPNSNDILDISLLKTDSVTGLITEISHSRLIRLSSFPVQFSMSYDAADIAEGETCTLIVTLLVENEVKRQGMMLLNRSEDGFFEASLTLVSV